MKKKGIKIGSDFLSLVVGFVLGFLIAFTYCWKTIMYVINVLLEK
ncbi:MAG: hypothetical protein PHP37_01745 [Patescibacteria group bacterium]|nr:hypothetical protein [Patescibacteria group bacterium]MDD4819203.1 hypothetical protein [Candidatus Colwellbacteria bacterium]